jgi:hypothetical protein
MHSVIKEVSVNTLSLYANYTEKQLLSMGAIELCIDRMLSRLQKRDRLLSFGIALNAMAVIAFTGWLSFRSGVREDFTFLLCFSPLVLIHVWRLSSFNKAHWNLKPITEVQFIAELWRRYPPSHSDSNLSTGSA